MENLNYALIKQSLIWTDEELGNLATIWKTGLSVTGRWEGGMAELYVNLRERKKEGGRDREQETNRDNNKWKTMRSRGWERQWEKLGLKVTLTDMKTTEVDLDIAKDGGGQISLMPKQGQQEGHVFDSSGEKHCQGHHISVLQIAICTHTALFVLHTYT